MSYPRGGRWVFDAPADAMTLRLAGQGGGTLTATVVNGAATFLPTQTRTAPAGVYLREWQLRDGTLVPDTNIDVAQSLAVDGAGAAFGQDTLAERMVQKLEALVETFAGSGEVSVSTPDGLSTTFQTRAELQAELARWKWKLARERGRPRVRELT